MGTPAAIESLAGLVPKGGQDRSRCPECLGAESSLSVRVDEAGGIHWKCFRASCGYTGGPRGRRNLFADRIAEPRYFTRPTAELTEDQATLIEERFGLNPEILDGYTPQDDRFILGVYGPIGYNRRGAIAYSLSGATPKSLTYNEKPAEPFIHYALSESPANDTPALVIVEDWFSAEKVATTGRAIGAAIMGTYLSQAHITELAAVAAAKGAITWLALDRDAYPKTIGYLNKYREQFPGGLFAWSLGKDLKYETAERITEALIDGKHDFIGDAQGSTNL